MKLKNLITIKEVLEAQLEIAKNERNTCKSALCAIEEETGTRWQDKDSRVPENVREAREEYRKADARYDHICEALDDLLDKEWS